MVVKVMKRSKETRSRTNGIYQYTARCQDSFQECIRVKPYISPVRLDQLGENVGQSIECCGLESGCGKNGGHDWSVGSRIDGYSYANLMTSRQDC